MEIIYVSNLISEKKMNNIIKNSKEKPLQSIQKFHRLICKGFVENGIEVKTISAIPMSRKISKQIMWTEKKEEEQGIKYKYLPFINIKIIRQICLLFFTICCIIKESFYNKREKIFICDILNTTISGMTLLLAKLLKIKCIAIVTDLPSNMGTKKNISKKINEFMQNKYDAYVLLTEQMNEVINPYNKPYIIVEGIADGKMKNKQNELDKKYPEKVCIYAGGLYKKYGVECLINAFSKLEDKDVRLHLYGNGELVQKLNEVQDSRIKYYGVVPNYEIIEEEIKATLLINPRYSNEEYTKYSFPSKNIEYMSTGTPVLTTNLKGIPKEYMDYIYIFEDETVDGYYNKLKEILGKSKSELHEKGKCSKKFVLENKNEIFQSKKIIDLIERI